jgi:predicted acetyltransferase
MPDLVPPDPRLRHSFASAMAEFRAEGRGSAGRESVLDGYLRDRGEPWLDDGRFGAFVESIRAQRLEKTARPEWRVPDTELWWVEEDVFLGRIVVRHRLTPTLLEAGGHIGYDIRPSARRRGHATNMLRHGLGVARRLGIDRALITCDADNVASRRVIEKNGGVFEDQRGPKLRFWVPTHDIPRP